MLQILDELSNPADFVEHFHNGNCVITLLASGERLFRYQNEVKTGWYRLPKSFRQLAGQLVQMGKDLKLLENAMPSFEMSSISNVLFVGNFVIGILNKAALVFFQNGFKDHLLKNHVDNVERYIAKNFNLTMINEYNHIVYITLVSLNKGPNLHALNEDLYLVLFGLEALKSRNQVLMLFLSDGHIWYVLLNDTFIPRYLYFLNSECVKVYADKLGISLTVCTKDQISYLFTAENNTLNVQQSWNSLKNNSNNDNFCNFLDQNQQPCTPCLHVKGRTVMFKKDMQCYELNHEEQLHQLRTSLNSSELEKQTLTTLVQERLTALETTETLAVFSSTESKSVKFFLTPDALEACWVSDSLPFHPFCILLSAESTSETFYSNTQRLHIPVRTALQYNNAVCFFHEKELWLKCGSVCYDIFDFLMLTYEQPKNACHFKFTGKIAFKKQINNLKELIIKTIKLDTSLHKIDLMVQVMNVLIHIRFDSKNSSIALCVSCNSDSILHQFCQSLTEKLKRNSSIDVTVIYIAEP